MSGLVFKCGRYTHPAGEVTIAQWGWTTEFSDRGVPIKRKYSCGISGEMIGDDVADLTARLIAFERAYAKQNQTVGMFTEAGAATAHVLTTGNALGGVRITGVVYPDGGGTEYVVSRKFSATFEADYLITDPGSANSVLEFTETISFQGTGGPRFIYLFPITGPPEKQTVQQKTTIVITQSGSSTGRRSYPPVPPPLLPADEHIEARNITMVGPKNQGGDKTEYGMQWSYTFETTSAPNITPHTQ